MRAASLAAAATLGGATLAACSAPASGGTARPTGTGAKIILAFQPNGTIPFNKTTMALYQDALKPFYAQHPGVDVRLVPPLTSPGGGTGNVQAILAGNGPDIIADYYPPLYLPASGDLLLKLDDYVKRDAVDLHAWSAGQVHSYTQTALDHTLRMLPGYFSPLIYVVRLQDFDEAGYQYPDPTWSYTDFAAAAKAMTKRSSNGQQRIGAVMQWTSTLLKECSWPFFGFGDGMLNAAGNAQLSSPGGIQAGNWLYDQLFWPGFATTRDLKGPTFGSKEVVTGEVTMQLVWDGLVLDMAQRYTGFNWDFYPPPTFPQGPSCLGTDDFYAIAANTKHPDMAWQLLKFLTYDPTPTGWQRSMMKIGMLQPGLNALWDVWIETLKNVAPPLKDKHLEYFKDMALSGRAFPAQFFPYADKQAQTTTKQQMAELWSKKVDVAGAFAQMDHQINATIAQAAAKPKTVAAPGPSGSASSASASSTGASK